MQEKKAVDLDAEAMDAQLAAAAPLIVEFWGPWCGPCKAMAPILDDASAYLEGRATIGKVDISAHLELATRHRVMSVPTFIRFENSHEVARHNGPLTAEQLEAFCTGHAVT